MELSKNNEQKYIFYDIMDNRKVGIICMFCKKCGNKLIQSDCYCSSCGNKVEETNNYYDRNNLNNIKKKKQNFY